MILETTYEPGYGKFAIYGWNFGAEPGSVVFETETGKMAVEPEQVREWKGNYIELFLPEGIKGTVSVYVEKKAQEKSSAYETELGGTEKFVVFSEDFETVEEGVLTDAEWSVSVANHASVMAMDTGKVLELKGASPNLEVFRLAEDGNVLK